MSFAAQVQPLGHSSLLDLESQWKRVRLIMPLQILIADDSRTFRHSLRGLLEQNPDWEVCAEAVDGVDAIAKAKQCKPDIMILDFFMPRMTGVEAAQVLGHVFPTAPILIVSLYVTPQLIMQAKNAGVKGVAQKSDISQLISGVEKLSNRRTFFESNRIEPLGETLL